MDRRRGLAARSGLAALAVGVVLAAVGCSGDDDAVPTTVPVTGSEVSTTAVPSSSSVAPSTTGVPSTTAPPTTVGSIATTVPSTTESPPTTAGDTTTTSLPDGVPPRVTFPDDPDLQAVVDAVYRYNDTLLAAQADPTNETLVAELLDASTGDQRDFMEGFLTDLADRDFAFVGMDTQPSYVDIVPPTVAALDDFGTADACAVAAEVLVEVDPDSGEETVVRESLRSGIVTYLLMFDAGLWRVSGLEVAGDLTEGENVCADS